MEKSIAESPQQELLKLQLEKERNLIAAQNIALKYLEDAINSGDSATVAAMAEMLKI